MKEQFSHDFHYQIVGWGIYDDKPFHTMKGVNCWGLRICYISHQMSKRCIK
jgi:hypothetical protein